MLPRSGQPTRAPRPVPRLTSPPFFAWRSPPAPRRKLEAQDRGCLGRQLAGREEIMKHAMATTVSRRGLLSRLLMAAAVAPVMGTMVVPAVDAKKIQPIKKRVQN